VRRVTYHSRFCNAIRAVLLARIDGQRASRRSLSRHSLTCRNCRNDRILASPLLAYIRLSVRLHTHLQ